jgi:hypothetical protein
MTANIALEELHERSGRSLGGEYVNNKCPTCGISVSEHPANRCMDAWVAEKVMGWTRPPSGRGWNVTTKFIRKTPEPKESEEAQLQVVWLDDDSEWMHFSTDIAAALEMVEKIGYDLRLIKRGLIWIAAFDIETEDYWHCAGAAPLVICRAALSMR